MYTYYNYWRITLQNFEYYAPTKVIFGKKTEQQVGSLIKKTGCKKVLVHYGGQSAKKSGLLETVFTSLKNENIEYIELGGVVPNPVLSLVRKGIELCKTNSVDFILAVGGGSVIDSAKAIAYGATTDKDVWDFYLKKAEATSCLPIGSILTISAAGSEMSASSVITNEVGLIKRGYRNDLCRCIFSILNPELTMSLPEWQTMSGVVDILMHTLERYFFQDSHSEENYCEMTDFIAEGLIKTTMHNAFILKDNPNNYKARAEIMWAGSLSHNNLTQCGYSQTDWASHQIEHELSGMFDVTHGAGLSAIWSTWAKYVANENYSRFATLGRNVFGIDTNDDKEAALLCIEKMDAFFESIGMPTRISKLGIHLTEEQIEELAFKCSFEKTRTIGTFKTLQFEDMKKIYTLAK